MSTTGFGSSRSSPPDTEPRVMLDVVSTMASTCVVALSGPLLSA